MYLIQCVYMKLKSLEVTCAPDDLPWYWLEGPSYPRLRLLVRYKSRLSLDGCNPSVVEAQATPAEEEEPPKEGGADQDEEGVDRENTEVSVHCECHRLTDQLGDWLIKWLKVWVTERLSNWATGQLSDWTTDWLSDWVSERLGNWVIVRLRDWAADWLNDWVTERLGDYLIEWLSDWVTGTTGLTDDWAAGRLSDCVTD